MSEHYTKATVSATAWCKKCSWFTMHRIDHGRLGPCMDCIAAPPRPVRSELNAAGQLGLFGVAAVAEAVTPGPANTQQVPAAGSELDADGASAPAANAGLGLFDLPIAGADVAQQPDEGAVLADGNLAADGSSGVVGQAMDMPAVAQHEVHEDAHGLDSVALLEQEQLCALSREFAEASSPEVVFTLRSSRWDHTPAMLAREANRSEVWLT